MPEDAARVLWADDYEFLRERARAHLHTVDEPGPVAASPPRGHVRVVGRDQAAEERDARPAQATARSSAAPARRRPSPRRAEAPRAYGSRTGMPAPAEPHRHVGAAAPAAERRTVVIGGQPTRRRRSPTVTRVAAEPDRTALWAVLLGIFLALVAVATAHAAPVDVHSVVHAAAHGAGAR